jgi:hypothetical protein
MKCDKFIGRFQQEWMHMECLGTPESLPSSSKTSQWVIREVKDSVLICGLTYSRWAGYTFRNGQSTIPIDEDHLSDKDEDVDWDTDENDDGLPTEDLFVSGGIDRFAILSHVEDIRDPQIYFLCAVKNRLHTVHDEWRYLLEAFHEVMRNWVCLQLHKTMGDANHMTGR